MIPKAGGDSTSKVNGPSVCSLLCTGCGLPFGLDICRSGLRGGYLNRCLVSVMVYLRWGPGSLLAQSRMDLSSVKRLDDISDPDV